MLLFRQVASLMGLIAFLLYVGVQLKPITIGLMIIVMFLLYHFAPNSQKNGGKQISGSHETCPNPCRFLKRLLSSSARLVGCSGFDALRQGLHSWSKLPSYCEAVRLHASGVKGTICRNARMPEDNLREQMKEAVNQ